MAVILIFILMLKQANLATHSMKTKCASLRGGAFCFYRGPERAWTLLPEGLVSL